MPCFSLAKNSAKCLWLARYISIPHIIVIVSVYYMWIAATIDTFLAHASLGASQIDIGTGTIALTC